MTARPEEPSAVSPGAYAKRGFIYRKLEAAGARFVEMNAAAVASDFGNPAAEADRSRNLAIADLSPLPRVGFKGPGTMPWLAGQGLKIKAVPNRAWRQPGGELAIARSQSEALILSDIGGEGDMCGRLEAAAPQGFEARAYLVPRNDGLFWFVLAGRLGSECLAKLCGIDLRPQKFEDGSVAQTVVAGISAVVARNDLGNTLAFHLLGDSASAGYIWDCLLDALTEFGAGPVGIGAIQALRSGIK